MRKQLVYDEMNANDRWMISYADVITMLFAFFVVMYALSSVQIKEYKTYVKLMGKEVRAEQLASMHDEKFTFTGKLPQIFHKKAMKVREKKDWVEIEIQSAPMFTRGTATPTTEGREVLKTLAAKLKQSKHAIVIEGHTDDTPLHGGRFGSNWALSAARAAAVVQVLDKNGVDSKSLSAVGYGPEKPIADNHTFAGRRKNRRMVILLSKRPSVKKTAKQAYLRRYTQEKARRRAIEAKRPLAADEQHHSVIRAIPTADGGTRYIRGVTTVKKGQKAPLIVEEKH